jgi:hypothetical protein
MKILRKSEKWYEHSHEYTNTLHNFRIYILWVLYYVLIYHDTGSARECWSMWTWLLCLLQGWTWSQWICLWIQILLTQQILTVCCVAALYGSLLQHHVGTPIAGCVSTAVWTTALPVLSVWHHLQMWVAVNRTETLQSDLWNYVECCNSAIFLPLYHFPHVNYLPIQFS